MISVRCSLLPLPASPPLTESLTSISLMFPSKWATARVTFSSQYSRIAGVTSTFRPWITSLTDEGAAAATATEGVARR